MKNGQISVTTENIFPIIKSALYSDHEIFLREIISNAIDATNKLKTISNNTSGEVPEFNEDDLKIKVTLDEENGILTVSDKGIGMTEDEIEKYINQIAYSGVTDFLDKYKENAGIIGHFGLGFYSSFLVSKKVEIVTRSYKKDSPLVKWSCDGSPEYSIEEVTENPRESWGTDVIMYLDDESKEEYGKKFKIQQLLNKYCKFLPIPIIFGKKTTWKDGKQVDTEEDNVINPDEPLWLKKPSELKDEDYKNFFRSLYPGESEPMFWIHLNVSEPFNLTGILFMPNTKNSIIVKKNTTNLYANRVFVTDIVEGIVPDFLQLLYGVIDSPDIPLNVSRSYLQSDRNVKKIAGYIEKKVADKLKSILKEDRKLFEEKWPDMKLFVDYGFVTSDTFYERAKDFALFTDTDGKCFTYDEYKTLIEAEQKDKDGNLVYLYATDVNEQSVYIDACHSKGYNVLLMDGQLDVLAIQTLEREFEKSKFARVDSDTINNLIKKDNTDDNVITGRDRDVVTGLFKSRLNNIDGKNFTVNIEHMGEDELPMVVSQNEWTRRQKDNRRWQSQSFMFGGMSDNYIITLNADHELIKKVWNDASESLKTELDSVYAEIDAAQKVIDDFNESMKDKKWEDRTEEEKQKENDNWENKRNADKKRDDVIAKYSEGNEIISQLIDVAFLAGGILKGDALVKFLKRTVSFIH